MNTTIVANWTMLLIGLGGFGIGLFWRAQPPSVSSAEKMAAEPRLTPGVIVESSRAPAETTRIEATSITNETLGAKEWEPSYARQRIRGWMVGLNLDPTKRSRAELALQNHVPTVRNFIMNHTGSGADRALQLAIDELTDALRPVLNDAEMAEFRRGLALQEIERAMNEIGADLYRQENPFTGEQIKRLTALMAESRSTQAQGAPVLHLSATDWDAVTNKSASFLSNQQLETVRALALRDQFNRQFRILAGYSINRTVPGL